MLKKTFILLGLMSALNVNAFRCGNQLISLEASYATTYKLCGEPVFKESYSKQFCHHSQINGSVNSGCISVEMDTLIYKRNGMTHTLKFRDKTLKSIDSCRVC
tara:strand:- start:75 stop:383 length:309 start_codon:yes stop_codon:yes gene_type:complete